MEGDVDPIHGSIAPPPPREERNSDLRLRRPRGPDAAADVREAAARLPRPSATREKRPPFGTRSQATRSSSSTTRTCCDRLETWKTLRESHVTQEPTESPHHQDDAP